MLLIHSEITNPFFNLAAEEYLLKHKLDDIFMIWISDPSVIVGKHQNTLAEINYKYVKENNIKVARRLSGGGTVYHDHGNVNFSFIKNGETGKLVDFKRFMYPVIQLLNKLGLQAEYGGRNDIILKGKKISGNAEHVYKKRILHHGTLLYSSNLSRLRGSLDVQEGVYTDKAVKSVRSVTTNIQDHLGNKMTINEFREFVFSGFQHDHCSKPYRFSSEEIDHINSLMVEKYGTWEWIYGYSPIYRIQKKIELEKYSFFFEANVKNGRFITFDLRSTEGDDEIFKNLPFLFRGKLHEECTMLEVFRDHGILKPTPVHSWELMVKELF